MAFHVRDHAGKQAVRELARIKAKTLTEPIPEAVEHEYAAIITPPPTSRGGWSASATPSQSGPTKPFRIPGKQPHRSPGRGSIFVADGTKA
jgi:hypothetical protein